METISNIETNGEPAAKNSEESEQYVSWLDVEIQHGHPNLKH